MYCTWKTLAALPDYAPPTSLLISAGVSTDFGKAPRQLETLSRHRRLVQDGCENVDLDHNILDAASELPRLRLLTLNSISFTPAETSASWTTPPDF
ncbi:hypothetical protein BGZ59_000196 [Podila verticillata]|nr:hypothetical protein BGZ59_000196 [Podila verticillata]